MANPDVLILPAGLAIQDLKGVKGIKGMVLVDISSAPHIDWGNDAGGVPVQTWTDLLESKTQHEPSDPAPVAIQSFTVVKKTFKAVDFTQQVQFLVNVLMLECHCSHCKPAETPSKRPCPDRKRRCSPFGAFLGYHLSYNHFCSVGVRYISHVSTLTDRVNLTSSLYNGCFCARKYLSSASPYGSYCQLPDCQLAQSNGPRVAS